MEQLWKKAQNTSESAPKAVAQSVWRKRCDGFEDDAFKDYFKRTIVNLGITWM